MTSYQQNNKPGKGINPNTVMRAVFGIIMIIVYVGMGVLLLINYFNWGGD